MNNELSAQIKGYISSILVHNATECSIHIDQALSLIYAFLLEKADNESNLTKDTMEYSKGIRKEYYGTGKKPFVLQSFSATVQYLFSLISQQSLEYKRMKLLGFSLKLIVGIEDSGYLNMSDRLYAPYQKIEEIDRKSVNEYIVSDFSKENNRDVENADAGKIIKDINGPLHKESVKEVRSDIRKAEGLSARWSLYSNLYRELTADAKAYRLECKYSWQWVLSEEEYKKIDKVVSTGILPTPGELDNSQYRRIVATILALYIGEKFKREGDPKKRITIKTDLAKKILEILNKTNYVKSKTTPLNSLYVDGGLPIQFIMERQDSSNALVRALERLLNPEDSDDEFEGENELLSAVPNTALKQSYEKNESIYQYIDYLKNENRTWDASDDNLFRGFTNLISIGREKAKQRNKFRLTYSLWQHEDIMGITPSIVFRPSYNSKYHYLVTRQLAGKWGITENDNTFDLEFYEGEDLICKFRFVRNCNNDYIEASRGQSVTFSTIMNDMLDWSRVMLETCSIRIVTENGHNISITRELKCEKLKNQSYLQFYRNEEKNTFHSWTSENASQYFDRSGVLFLSDEYEPIGVNFLAVSSSVGWAEFTDVLELRSKINVHNNIILHNRHGKISAKPFSGEENNNSLSSLHPICKQKIIKNVIDDGFEISLDNGEVTSPLYLVKHPCQFKVTESNEKRVVDREDYDVYYYRGAELVPYDENSIVSGFVRFYIKKDLYSTVVNCIVLPDNAALMLEPENKRIRFRNISASILGSKTHKLSPFNDDQICTDLGKDKSDTIQFSWIIQDNEMKGNASFEVYRPINHVIGSINGQPVDGKGNVLLVLAADANLKSISGEGISNIDLVSGKKIYNYTFERLWDYDYIRPIESSIKQIRLRLYTHEISDNNDPLKGLKWGFLDLQTNEVKLADNSCTAPIAWAKEGKREGLLFQSLCGELNPPIYCVPRYIARPGEEYSPDRKDRLSKRKKRLDDYCTHKDYLSDAAMAQFEVAIKHKMYFEVLDILLSLIWQDETQSFRPKPKRLYEFFKCYKDYCHKHLHTPSISGLIRLSREYGFDWSDINRYIQKSDDDDELTLYKQLTTIKK